MPGRDHRAVHYGTQRESRLESGQHLVLHQVPHLERDARQRYDYLAVTLEPHARGCPVCIEQHRAALRNHRLAAVEFVELYAALRQHAAHVFLDFRVVDQTAAEHARKGGFGYVVLCGAEPAGGDDDVAAAESLLYAAHDLCGIVTDRGALADDYACCVELLRYVRGVGIDDLTYQNLVADCYDLCIHGYWRFASSRISARHDSLTSLTPSYTNPV